MVKASINLHTSLHQSIGKPIEPYNTTLTMRSLLLLAAAALASAAANLTVSIPASQHLPNPSALPPSTHAILLGPPGIRYDALLRRDNTFLFPELPSASYLLTVHSRDYFFAPLRVDVTPGGEEESQSIEAWQTFRGNEWSNKGPSYGAGKGSLTILVRAAAPKDFYQVRGGFNLLSFFKNPMILMGLFSVVMIFGMPYLMENSMFVSPYEKAQMLTYSEQWTPKRKRNSRKCRVNRRSQARMVLRTSCRISIWQVGWRGVQRRLRRLLREVAGRRSRYEANQHIFNNLKRLLVYYNWGRYAAVSRFRHIESTGRGTSSFLRRVAFFVS